MFLPDASEDLIPDYEIEYLKTILTHVLPSIIYNYALLSTIKCIRKNKYLKTENNKRHSHVSSKKPGILGYLSRIKKNLHHARIK